MVCNGHLKMNLYPDQSTVVTNWNQPILPKDNQQIVPFGQQGQQFIPLEPYPVYMPGQKPEDMNQLNMEENALALGAAFYKDFAKKVDKASRYFFPSSFALFCLVYWVHYLYSSDQLPEAMEGIYEYVPDIE